MQQQLSNSISQCQRLVQLPQECLVSVLQQLRDGDAVDTRSVCRAARAHSRLHAGAVAALSSITAKVNQPKLDSLLLHLAQHGQHVTSLDVARRQGNITLRELPPCSQLRSLRLDVSVQLGASSNGHQGVLQAMPQLSKLELRWCTLLDTDSGALTAALTSLSGLRHLSLPVRDPPPGTHTMVPVTALAQLAHLEVPNWLLGSDADIWTRLDSLSQLQWLGLTLWQGSDVPAGAFSSLRHLTRLALSSAAGGRRSIEPAALAALGQLQHLALSLRCTGEEEGAAAFLQQLGQLTQLSHLELDGCLRHHAPSPAAFSALTASTRLQHLQVEPSYMPETAWQHVFPAERQRSALQELKISFCYIHSQADVEAMVAACPGLQRLTLQCVQGQDMEAEPLAMLQLLAPLSRLVSLRELAVMADGEDAAAVASVVAQLSGLRSFDCSCLGTAGLLALTQLRQLTSLRSPELSTKTEGSTPDVWRQVLEHCQQQDDDLGVRQAAWQAAAYEAQLEQLRQQLGEQRASQARQQREHDWEVAQLRQALADHKAGVARQLAELRQQLVGMVEQQPRS